MKGTFVIFISLLLLSEIQSQRLFALSFNTIPDALNYNRGVAPTQEIQTTFKNKGTGVGFHSQSDEDISAVWLSLVVPTDDGFQESGNITFGDAENIIFFKSQVDGVSGETGLNQYGTIAYEITGGAGIYADAQGWLVDMFWAYGNSPSFFINTLGLFYVPGQEKLTFQPPQLQFQPQPEQQPPAPQDEENPYIRVEFVSVFENLPLDGVNHARAPSQSITTQVTYDKPVRFEVVDDSPTSDATVAVWTSVPVGNPNGTFTNTGVIDLLERNVTIGSIKFESNTLGQSRNATEAQDEYGGITYFITDGTGVWEGATGVMIDLYVSSLTAPPDTPSPIYAWALFWIPNKI